jgi:hypothetical protein
MERILSDEEKLAIFLSQQKSLDLVREIYRELTLWRIHELESHQKKANHLKLDLDEHLEKIIPFHVANTNSYSPPPQKKKRVAYGGRRTRRRL